MKHLHFISVFVMIIGLAATQAWAQGEDQGIMILNSREFVQHEEPLVRFDHNLHENIIRCLVCHHDFKVYSNRNNGKGSRCSTCHKREPNKEIPVSLRKAFHGNCKGCHKRYSKWGWSSGPVNCEDCHIRE
jgi:hypothetical protein